MSAILARRSHPGLGIGLALVKNLVELHGGQVEIASEGVGLGTEVTVRLARLKSSLQADTPKIPAAKADPSLPLRGVSILLVEDSDDSRETMQLMLERLGAEVLPARDGREALSVFETHEPHLVLCDLCMPRMDGFEFIGELRRIRGSNHPPVIAVSGLVTEADHERTRAAGFQGHLDKPFNEASLLSMVAQVQHAA